VIGLLNVAFYFTMLRFGLDLVPALVLSGALIHVGFEFAGLNEWWCKVTYPRS
jgi:hypothetical protein